MWSARDHPRVCGEKSFPGEERTPESGSPPRVRGKVFPGQFKSLQLGITPACAGKSMAQVGGFLVIGDHPRVCGEKGIPWLLQLREEGSPPRVRGKALLVVF